MDLNKRGAEAYMNCHGPKGFVLHAASSVFSKLLRMEGMGSGHLISCTGAVARQAGGFQTLGKALHKVLMVATGGLSRRDRRVGGCSEQAQIP